MSKVIRYKELLSDLVTDPYDLVGMLELDIRHKPASLAAIDQFPMKVPRWFVSRIKTKDWNDPILRQLWPDQAEEADTANYVVDPLEESRFNPVPGLLHKYTSRVLLTAATHCAVHCRYCFRRHFDYDGNAPSRKDWQAAFDHIKADSQIQEVLLSGGDPLGLSNKQIKFLVNEIENIPHVNTIRIHTRMTIVLPQRVDKELIAILAASRLKVVVVSHCNHTNELSHESYTAFENLASAKVTLLNQSVILAGVNNDCDTLISLSRGLFEQGVLPYYIHLPDAVAGTAHFDVPLKQAQQIIGEVQAQLPGYLVPRLVREEPGKDSKTRYA
tara:strand:+ start:88 stop:1074 length:987 start_codon:yes stop_codon:yes gene_type:complete